MRTTTVRRAAFAAVLLALPALLIAQGIDPPLRLQGMDRWIVPGARAAGMGGVSIAIGGTANAVFSNPAALAELQGIDLRIGAGWNEHRTRQTQSWIPNRFYTNLSLLMENLLAGIKDPVVTDPRDAVQRSYDDLTPNWVDLEQTFGPTSASAAMPLEIAGTRAVVAVGWAKMFDLNYFFRNNNAMDPYIGRYRPSPIPVLRGSDTLVARWYSSTHRRTGGIYGITPGLSVDLLENLSLGAGLTILTGSSDDTEQQVERGRLVFDAVYRFRNDYVFRRMTSTGTSDYSGVLPMLGAQYRDRYFGAGVSVRLPGTITREWSRTMTLDTTGATRVVQESGKDEVKVPLNYALGFALFPRPEWKLAVDYVVREYQDAEVTAGGGAAGQNDASGAGAAVKPWLGGKMLRLGAEFRASRLVTLRGGYREEVAVFAPDGTGLIDEPARGSFYTAGLGLCFGPVAVDLAYEYMLLKYQDLYETNVNDNKQVQHGVLGEISVAF